MSNQAHDEEQYANNTWNVCCRRNMHNSMSYSKRTTMTLISEEIYFSFFSVHINISLDVVVFLYVISAPKIVSKNWLKFWLLGCAMIVWLCDLVFIYLHIKVLIVFSFLLSVAPYLFSFHSLQLLFFWPLNGQRHIRGPSGLTFFFVERHKQWHFNHGKIKICKF